MRGRRIRVGHRRHAEQRCKSAQAARTTASSSAYTDPLRRFGALLTHYFTCPRYGPARLHRRRRVTISQPDQHSKLAISETENTARPIVPSLDRHLQASRTRMRRESPDHHDSRGSRQDLSSISAALAYRLRGCRCIACRMISSRCGSRSGRERYGGCGSSLVSTRITLYTLSP